MNLRKKERKEKAMCRRQYKKRLHVGNRVKQNTIYKESSELQHFIKEGDAS